MLRLAFTPEKHGFHFTNLFINHPIPNVPVTTSGLCGGMALAAARYWQHQVHIPNHVASDFPDGSPAGVPPEGSALQGYLYGCQLESFGPLGIASAGNWITMPWQTLDNQFQWSYDEFPKIAERIDAGVPVVLGLRRVLGGPMGHQVLAYGYDEADRRVFVYDSNVPEEEKTLRLDVANRKILYDDAGSPEWSSYFITGCRMDGPRPDYVDLGLPWTKGPYYGTRGTYFADLTGDGKADAIVVNDDAVTVRRNTGIEFGPNEDWTHGAFYGTRGTYFADLTGDGKADAIVVNDDTVTVRRNTGSGFGPNEDWTQGAFYGTRGTYFADLTGDGKADAIVVNDNAVTVRRNTGTGFGPNEDWTHGAFYGTRGTYFADVTGDGKADAIALNNDTMTVRRNTGSGFGPNDNWTQGPFYGTRGTHFANLTGDGKADAIAVKDTAVVVRRSQ
jgi:hypothetical protein